MVAQESRSVASEGIPHVRSPVARATLVRVRFTRLGLHTAFIAVFAMVGGALRGFNLLLILAGLLVGLLFIQWRLSRRSLESVRVRRQTPDDVLAGSVFRVRFQVESVSAWLPSWLVVLTDTLSAANQRQRTTATCGLGYVPPASHVEASYDCRIERRGRYLLGPVQLCSGFPFGLLEAKRKARRDEQVTLYVYPHPLLLKPHWQGVLQSKAHGVSSTQHRAGPSEGEFYGLRQWQSGDSRRWIHWRTTARIGEPAVRQFEQQRRYDMCILVDACMRSEEESDEAVERTIRLAATLLTQLARSPTSRVTLVVQGRQLRRDTLSGGRGAMQRAMRLLSETEPAAPGSLVDALEASLESMQGERPIVILSSQPTSAERLTESAGRRVGRGIDHLDICWLDVNGPAVQQMVQWEDSSADAPSTDSVVTNMDSGS